MTLTATTTKLSYNGDGSTTSFAVSFVFWDDDDLRVILRDANDTETVWTKGTQYNVTGGDGSTGTVTVVTSPTDYTPASGEKLIIKSNLTDTQNTSLPAGGSFPSADVEETFDKNVRLTQQQAEEIARSIKFTETSADSDISFPDVTGNASKVLQVNSGATGLQFSTIASTSEDLTVPASSTNNAIVRFDGTTGTSLQNSGVTIDDNDSMTVPGNLKLDKGADVASAAALTLGTDGNFFDITGTTTITSIGTLGIGTQVALQFDGALTLTHDATDLILPGGVDITTAAGDVAHFVEYASGDWLCTSYQPASGAQITQGKHTIWVPANAMRPTSSNGCATITDVETTAGRPDMQVLDFDASSDEHAQFGVAMPKSWNEGTVTFEAYWTTTATDTDGVAWGLQGVACADNDTIDVAYGTAVVVTDDNQSAAEDMLVTSESSAITLAGSPAAGEMSFFRVFRDVSDANDDMTEDARLIGIKLFLTINAGDDS